MKSLCDVWPLTPFRLPGHSICLLGFTSYISKALLSRKKKNGLPSFLALAPEAGAAVCLQYVFHVTWYNLSARASASCPAARPPTHSLPSARHHHALASSEGGAGQRGPPQGGSSSSHLSIATPNSLYFPSAPLFSAFFLSLPLSPSFLRQVPT